jgi:hypothetical protein
MAKKYFAALMGAALMVGLGFVGFAEAGKFTYANKDCRGVNSKYICTAYAEKTTFGVLAEMAKSFEYFKKINSLPDDVTPNTPVPPFTMYAYKIRGS